MVTKVCYVQVVRLAVGIIFVFRMPFEAEAYVTGATTKNSNSNSNCFWRRIDRSIHSIDHSSFFIVPARWMAELICGYEGQTIADGINSGFYIPHIRANFARRAQDSCQVDGVAKKTRCANVMFEWMIGSSSTCET
jgi:hypothetical protein